MNYVTAPSVTPDDRAARIAQLKNRIEQLEGPKRPLAEVRPSGTPLDRLLPHGGFAPGVLVEWLAEGEGSGAGVLSLLAARGVMQGLAETAAAPGALVVVDRERWFYPPAAAALGIDLENTIAVRPSTEQEEIWAVQQALRCPGAAVVWAALGPLDDRAFRRLQLAAEEGGAIGFLLRSSRWRRRPSWAEVQFLATPLTCRHGHRLRVHLSRCRGAQAGRFLEMEINEATGALRECRHEAEAPSARPVAARLAHSATGRRSARA
ncbi:ImuA family protein [Lignipirellula cremea]|uniref:ImuA family protein n=1 Tax=Lignipirellula cremea TaxID=2528010 RepID=UPI00119CE9DC|nr:hypothetical protein [Lignipirellula cremea]